MGNIITIKELTLQILKFKPFILQVREMNLVEELTFLKHNMSGELELRFRVEIPDSIMLLCSQT